MIIESEQHKVTLILKSKKRCFSPYLNKFTGKKLLASDAYKIQCLKNHNKCKS